MQYITSSKIIQKSQTHFMITVTLCLEVHRLSADNWYQPIIGQFADNWYRPFDNRHRPIIGRYRYRPIICFSQQNYKNAFNCSLH